MNKTVLLLALSLGLIAGAAAATVDPINTKGRQHIAVHGYDVVSYFQDTPKQGSASFSHSWMGATWHFVSADNRDLFVADPERYAPQYGGYCAYAVSKGSTADVDPEVSTIFEDKLYLNYSKSVRTRWRKDIPGNVARADSNWPKLLAD